MFPDNDVGAVNPNLMLVNSYFLMPHQYYKTNTIAPLPFRCPHVAMLFTYDVTPPRCQLVAD